MPDQPIQLVNPNLHAILIHFPIALLFIGTAIELFAFMWRRTSFRSAGRWMILIGAMFIIPAATTGLYAARQVMGAPDLPWNELKTQATLNAAQWDHLVHHVRFNFIAAIVLALLVVSWVGASDRIRAKAHFAYLLLLLAAVGLIATGAWRGGEMVYAEGTGMKLVQGGWPSTQKAAEAEKRPTTSPTDDKSKVVFGALSATGKQLTKFDDVTDIHVQLAGFAVAFAVVTLGLSLRGLWLDPRRVTDDAYASDDDIANALAGRAERAENRSLLDSEKRIAHSEIPDRVPAARFWLLVALLGIMTVLSGWMLLEPGSMKEAIQMLKDSPRYLSHSIVGVAIVVLTLSLALVTRFGPYNRVLVGAFSLMLAIALGVQLWLGILLMFDTQGGAIYHFNPPATQPSMT